MTHYTATYSGQSPSHVFADTGRASAPVLIRVPTLRPLRSRRPTSTRVRRRLRREVRVAASILLLALPVVWAGFALRTTGTAPKASSRKDVSIASAIPPGGSSRTESNESIEDAPSVAFGLSIAPALAPSAPAAASEAEGPVVAPAGYLVPDESPEEASNEGR